MTVKDGLIALFVIVAWGINFLFMKLPLMEISPILLGFLRFVFLLFPVILFVKVPKCDYRWLIFYGLAISFGQFSLMFLAIHQGMPTSLAALVHQAQVFFTVILASVFFKEKIRVWHVIAMTMAIMGLALIGVGQYQGVMPMIGVWLVLASAFSWAVGNLIVKKLGNVKPLPLVIWGNVSTLIAFGAMSVVMYGIGGVAEQIGSLTWQGWIGVLYLAYVAGLLGYSSWGYLLSRYPTSQIAPLTLIVPVLALFVGFSLLKETLNAWHWIGAVVIMTALVVQVFGGRILKKLGKS
ncbi:EamA family transporter [Neisseria animalis]|uniref:EamA family transporter n=1 Tax=Neisseria animalis TaxID=492 RepID=A0A5P3MRA8_NEIAN|nr:EamA family transporter [Neisseria animalis]QEY24137.1 EamA family transporter [Neisseria animalis]ROW31505.1 EamA family transporter [Neisseria animalis]VEE06358.1 Probable amino-acid metabolite efflux pump [Neisseria animalis]